MKRLVNWLSGVGLLALIVLALTFGGCADADYDRDGWSARQEWQAGTDPQLADTDGDGIIDSEDAAPLDSASVSANLSGTAPTTAVPTTTVPITTAPTTTVPTTTAPTATTPTTTAPTTTAPTTTAPTTTAPTTTTPTTAAPLPGDYLALNQPYTSQLGMTVTVTSINVAETATTYRFSVSYTLQNQTSGSLSEGGFALNFDEGDPKVQAGFFGSCTPGQTISKSFTLEEPKSSQRHAFSVHYWDSKAEVDHQANSLTWEIPSY